MGPTILTDADFSASARSSPRFTTWLILTPAAGSNSYDVMIGPGLTWTIRPSTSKSWSFRRMVSALSWSSSRVRLSSDAGGTLRSPTGGSWKVAAPPRPKSNVSCHASPCSASRPRGREGSTTTGSAARHARGLREQPRGGDEKRAEPGQRHPAPHDDRPQERGGAPGAEQERQKKSGIAE